MVGACPSRRLVEIGGQRGAVGGASPGYARQILEVGPTRALVGEAEWLVEMESDQDVAVVLRQFEQGQVGQAVPVARADDDSARRIRLANQLEQVDQQGIPRSTVERFMRLVEQFERDRRRRRAIARGELRPYGAELDPAACYIDRAFVEIMLVEDHPEARAVGLANDPVEPLEPGWIDPVGPIQMREDLQIDTDEVEAAAPNFGKVAGFEMSLCRVLPDRIIAKHVHAAMIGSTGPRRIEPRRRFCAHLAAAQGGRGRGQADKFRDSFDGHLRGFLS